MTKAEFVNSCLFHPEILRLNRRRIDANGKLQYEDYTDAEKRNSIEASLPEALAACASAYPFPFLTKTTTYTGGTTSGTASYTLSGEDQDCMEVLTILYDTDELFLEYYEQPDVDRLVSQVGNPSTVVAWTNNGFDGAFPSVTLYLTPDETGTQIKYRYWRRPAKITIEEWPDDWVYVVKSNLISRIIPALTEVAKDDLARMINAHNKGGGKVRRIIQDTTVTQLNMERNRRFGWGGTL